MPTYRKLKLDSSCPKISSSAAGYMEHGYGALCRPYSEVKIWAKTCWERRPSDLVDIDPAVRLGIAAAFIHMAIPTLPIWEGCT